MPKPTRQTLSNAVNTALSTLSGHQHDLDYKVHGVKREKVEGIYEAYIFCLVVRAIQLIPTTTSIQVMSSSPNRFNFRRRASTLADTPNPYSYIIFDRSWYYYELHMDTYACKRLDGARLELDVMIVGMSTGEARRHDRKDVPKRGLKVAIEVKFLGGALGTGIAKEFLGINSQLGGSAKAFAIATNTYLTGNARQHFDENVSLDAYESITPLPAHATLVDNMINAFQPD